MVQPRGFDQLVVIGASAGGIEALSRLVAGLPADFPAPIVVAQHIDPTRASHLRQILEHRTALRVVTVESSEALQPGVIYVVPNNRNVEISDHSVAVAEDAHIGPMPSVDLLLRTAARAFGERLIAVILSGAGSDGAAGARAVKVAGGAVVIQDPETAGFSSMPSSVAPTTVDVVATADGIGPLLVDLLSGRFQIARPADDETLTLLLEQLREQSGIDFGRYKRPTILRRLERRMAAVKVADLRQYLAYIEDNPAEYQRLISSFLIKVTEFFRDEELFGLLRSRIVPQLIADARSAGRRELRIWSAGCATGEEPYSLAMIVADLLGDELDRWTVRIFSTDVDEDAIAFARRGVYPGPTVESLPAGIVGRHFARIDGSYLVSKSIRGLTVFGQHDLAMRAPFPRLDLVLCRNVLIYFTPELQRRALQLFAFSLRDGGVLVLGKAESTSRLAASFVLEDAALKVYRRQGERITVPPHGQPMPAAMPRPKPARPAARTAPATADAAVEDTLQRMSIGIVEIDANYDIRTINRAARALLGIRGIAIGKDLVHLARTLSANELRATLDQALAGRASARVFLIPSPDAATSSRIAVNIEARPIRPATARGDAAAVGNAWAAGAVVLIDDASGSAATEVAEAAEHERRDGMTRGESVEEHARRLSATNQGLVADNEELSQSNIGLRAENEQLLVASEEAQAAAEEVETLNEELQATNEELETLNEELQATNEELNTTNDDMESRQRELEELTSSLVAQHGLTEHERARLSAVITGMRDAIVVVDETGAPTMENDAYGRLSEASTGSVGGEEGPPTPTLEQLRLRAGRGESFTTEFWTVDQTGARHWYEVYGQGVLVDGEPHGGILVIRDITERSLRRLQNEFVGMVAHELRTPLTALRGYLQLLDRMSTDAAGDPRASRYSSLALEQAERLQALIADLFETARVDAGKLTFSFTDVDLGDLVVDATDIARSLSSRHRIVVGPVESGLRVSADPGRIQQVLLNVISNAVTHAPGSERIDVHVTRHGRDGVVDVADHGPGIPAADLPVIFTRYRQGTGSGGGLGLGLFISREIVVAHGGTIRAAATAGGGTTISMRLPLIDTTASPDSREGPTPDQPPPASRGGARRPKRSTSA
jgi:two-component system CheB/CheR fusion protein